MEFEAGSTSGSPRLTRNKIVLVRSIRCNETPLNNYPFAYLAEAGSLDLNDAEVEALPEYLLGGGFLMVDDFWGDDQ